MIRIFKNFAHLLLAIGANTLYGFPGRKLVVIGVTGTDGKTTTSSIIYHILKAAKKKAALISTIGAEIDGVIYNTGFHVTTPSPFSVQKYLSLARKKGCEYVVLEVTSHALDQNRVWGIPYEIGVLTNITHEHLDYHKSYLNYVRTKLKLFKKSKIAIVNSNGEWFTEVKKTIPHDKLVTYSLHGKQEHDVTVINLPFKIKTVLLGDFNLENILAASVAALKLGVEPDVISAAVASFEAPVGRQEIIKKREFTVMVDFAHTANSFESLLPTLRINTVGRLIHVFGAAGKRDHQKRSEMGKVAAFYDDIIILTAEDPRSEKVGDINKEIKKGISGFNFSERLERGNGKMLYEIDDRGEAIKFALSLAKPHDTIVVTGKGHEKSMNFGRGEVGWSDQEVIKELLK